MLIGRIFGRGVCRCGSAADARPLTAAPVQPQRGGDPALGPAFGPLPAPIGAWTPFRWGAIEVFYTLNRDAHPAHALPDAIKDPPKQADDCVIGGIALGRVEDLAHPAHVQKVALMAEHCLGVYRGFGFRVPASLRIHLCTFGTDADANFRGGTEVWLDHVWVSTRLNETDALLTVAHEVFHRVQYEYNATIAKTSPFYAALREGGARLAEDWVLDSGDRYLKDGIEFLEDPGRPLMHHPGPGPEIPPHSYAAALFWRWLCEQHGEIRSGTDGIEVMRTILETMKDGSGYILTDLREARGAVVGEGHLDAFQHLDRAAGETLSTETDWGNFLVANWMHGTASPTPDKRFDYVEDDDLGGSFSRRRPFVWPGEKKTAADLAAKPFAFEIPRGAVRAGFSARYTVVDLSQGTPPPLLRLDFKVLEGMEDPLVQVLMIGRNAAGKEDLKDLLRSDRTDWTTFIPTKGLTQVVVIVAAREHPGRYRIALAPAAGQVVLHAAACNAAPGRSYETDPREGAWPWTSPDVALDGDAVRVRVTNRGDAPSGPVTVTLAAQGTTRDVPLRAGRWTDVGEATTGSIAPGATAEFRIPWTAPRTPAAATGWGLRARIASGGAAFVVLSSVGRLSLPDRIDAVL
ncbi:hypothetical protein [Neoroseomonas oryzicola]|uniref:Uncharacterized protein n=1 Tax=Neoroseomonas oryzicola TaxID=535904 RepID=A0A9X9WM32_9PROT|nr:hypothetical protein [Neoroseomonas oryzicola]MBR0661392.1 hypothetical protein [Neoroseomonas oryzicola]NKE19279.1 hypothetical protein [Neoroseomonas oryzicola]